MRPPGRSFLALLTLLTLPFPSFLMTLRTWRTKGARCMKLWTRCRSSGMGYALDRATIVVGHWQHCPACCGGGGLPSISAVGVPDVGPSPESTP